jgi:hypothetical protein
MSTPGGGHLRLTASGAVKASAGRISGFYVANTTAGTVTLYDNASAASGTQMSGLITPAIGFHRFPARFSKGCWAEIGGALDVTFFIET